MAGYYLMYLRKSRADAEKERYGKYETLAVHEKALTELARRERYPVAEVYRELVSGESIEERAQFKRVMERIADPDCEGVIVHAIDRLGRGDPMEYGWVLSSFRWTSTKIVTPGRVYDPADPSDLQQLKLQMFVANIELEHIRERMRQGSVASAERGNYLGSKPPYGYDKVPGKPAITPSGTEAPVVRTIFRMAASGSNKGQIARHLNDSGVPTRHGKTWMPARVGAIISNPVYKGVIRYGYRRQKVVSREGMRFIRKTSVSGEGSYVLAKGLHEPIVDEGTWEAAQKVFEAAPVPRDRALKNPLAGLIFCGECGRAMIRQVVVNKQGRKYPRLRHVYDNGCHCRSASLEQILGAVCDALEHAANDIETGATACGADPEEMRAIERALAEEDRRLDKLMELFYAEAITVDEFKQRRRSSEELTRRLRERHDELSARDVDPVEVVCTTREAIRMLKDPAIGAEARNSMLKSFVDRIDYWGAENRGRDVRLDIYLKGSWPSSSSSNRSDSTHESA